ncbi:MAG: nucleotidyltransferase domain-containing protein [Planctomycetota bacterium]
MNSHDLSLIRDFRRRLSPDAAKRLRGIRIFGSRARGAADPDSDLDLLVLVDHWDAQIEEQIEDAAYAVMQEDDFRVILSLKIFSEKEFSDLARRGWSFFRTVQREGIPV